MTMKLFIAFLSILFAIWTVNVLSLPPLFLSFVCCSFFTQTKQERHWGKEERRKDVAGYWYATSSQTLILHSALCLFCEFYSRSTRVLLDNYRIQASIFFPACLSFKVNLLFVLLLLFKVKEQNKSIANSLVQVSKLSISVCQCAYQVIFNVGVHLQAWKPSINLQLQWPLL